MAIYAPERDRSAQEVYRRIQWAIIACSILLVLNAVATVAIFALEMRLSGHRVVLPYGYERNGKSRLGSHPSPVPVARDRGASNGAVWFLQPARHPTRRKDSTMLPM